MEAALLVVAGAALLLVPLGWVNDALWPQHPPTLWALLLPLFGALLVAAGFLGAQKAYLRSAALAAAAGLERFGLGPLSAALAGFAPAGR